MLSEKLPIDIAALRRHAADRNSASLRDITVERYDSQTRNG